MRKQPLARGIYVLTLFNYMYRQITAKMLAYVKTFSYLCIIESDI